jgi:HEAT repeat protein
MAGSVFHDDKAVQALVLMGEDAVPYLMKQLAIQDSRLREFLAGIIQKIPGLKVRRMSQYERFLRASTPLMLMGRKAHQAVPELLRLAQDNEFRNRQGAVQLLGYIASQPELRCRC